MGFSVSASTAIIFAGLFLAAGILYPAMDNGMERVLDAQNDRDQAQLDLRNTDISITEAESDSITVRNTGSTSLTVSEVDLLVDGDYQERGSYTTTVDGSDNLWLPGETLTLENFDTDDAEDQIKVVTEHGISVTAFNGEEF